MYFIISAIKPLKSSQLTIMKSCYPLVTHEWKATILEFKADAFPPGTGNSWQN